MKIKNVSANLPFVECPIYDTKEIKQKLKWTDIHCIAVAYDADEFFANVFTRLVAYHKDYYWCRVNYNKKRYVNIVCKRHGNKLIICSDKLIGSKTGDEIDIKVNSMKEVEIESDTLDSKPMFTNRNKVSLDSLKSLYMGASAFIISSGPSFKNFKQKELLRNVFTCCVNNSSKALQPDVMFPDMEVFVDHPSKFLYHLFASPKTMVFCPEGHMNKGLYHSDLKADAGVKTNQTPNIIYYKRNNIFNPERFLIENSINWGNNKSISFKGVRGKRSVLIATIKILHSLGFKNVFLLGVDFNMSVDNLYSFPQSRKGGSINGNNASYRQMKVFFQSLQPYFLKDKFHVYNLNPSSELDAFPFMNFKEAYRMALDFTPNIDKFIRGELCDTNELYNTNFYQCKSCGKEKMYDKDLIAQNSIKCECGKEVNKSMKKKGF